MIVKKPRKLSVAEVARLISYYGVRNSELENLHVHSISDAEMRVLMLDIEANVQRYIQMLVTRGILQIRRRSLAYEMVLDGELPKADEESLLAIDTADWHFILANGPTYDRKDWPQG